MFSPDQWLASTGAAFYNNVATQSLRFDRGSSAHLARTPSSEGNRRTWTASFWVKRANFNTSESQNIFMGASDNVGYTDTTLFFDTNTEFGFYDRVGGYVTTSRKFRDPSAWYHIVVVLDTTQSTASDRLKIYVNGSQETSLTNSTYPAQDSQKSINDNVLHWFGGRNYSPAYNYLGAYLAEFNLIDGTALTPTSFGETKNGVWIPIEYTGSYGTNGFRLQFNQTGTGTASASTIGADTSGNTNHYTSSGIVASDCNMPDSPENNFCTMNSLDKQSQVTLSEGTLKVRTSTTGGGYKVRGTMQLSGKVYFEGLIGAVGGNIGSWFGIADNSDGITDFNSSRRNGLYYNASDFRKAVDGSFSVISSGALSANDIIGLAYNFDDNEFSIYRNNSAVLTDATFTNDVGFSPIADLYRNDSTDTGFIFNFGQDSSFAGAKTAQGNTDANGIGDFYYAPPSGFLALCSANLPEPTISPNADTQADDYFNTVLYTGNATARSITGVGFQPDWVWLKNRSLADNHTMYDSNRGVTKVLKPNLTNAESTVAQTLTSFGADGFSLGTDAEVNHNTSTFASWNWKANGGTTSSNTDGSITSTVQANTTSGFSIVLYTGFSGSSGTATVGHSLSQSPEIIIHKSRTRTSAWWVQAPNVLSTASHFLDFSTAAPFNLSSYGTMSAPTSSVFSINGVDGVGGESANYVAYCFHSVEGYSKIGSYTGNGSTDGTFVYTGFRPAWVLIKRFDASGTDWMLVDSTRDTINPVDNTLFPSASTQELDGDDKDFVSNGFKHRSTGASENASSGTYIYMAFAEAPFKYANAR